MHLVEIQMNQLNLRLSSQGQKNFQVNVKYVAPLLYIRMLVLLYVLHVKYFSDVIHRKKRVIWNVYMAVIVKLILIIVIFVLFVDLRNVLQVECKLR